MVPMMLAVGLAHTAPCALPAASWGTKEPSGVPGSLAINYVGLEPGELLWNWRRIDERELARTARAVPGAAPRPLIYFYSPVTDCATVRRIAAIIATEARCTPKTCFAFFTPVPRIVATSAPSPQPAPRPSPGKRPTPRNAPQAWVVNDDYPAEAMRHYWMGTTGFRLDIDADGQVYDCAVTSSSGYPVLDEMTCALLKERAQFNPAEDASGTRIGSSWSSRFRWELPADRSPFASWVRIVRYEIDGSGKLLGCKAIAYGPAPEREDECTEPKWTATEAFQWSGTPLWIEVRETHRAGTPLPAAPQAQSEVRFQRVVHYNVGVDGRVTGCRVISQTPDGQFEPSYDCHPGLDYSPADAANARKNPKQGIDQSFTFTSGPLTR